MFLVVVVVGVCVGVAVWLVLPGASNRLPALFAGSDGAGAGGSGSGGAAGVGVGRKGRGRSAFARVWGWVFGQHTLNESAAEALAFDLELVAICLRAGLPVERALMLAAEATEDRSGLGRLGRSLALGAVDNPPAGLHEVVSLVEFSRATGVALAPLLAGLAADMRRTERRRRQMAAAKLGVHLVIPLGVCVLPAVILMGVIPVVITLVGDMAGVFLP